MNKKKIIALALVTMLSLGGLTGCNKKDDTTKTDNKETTTETENKDETSSTEESKDNEETTDSDEKKNETTDSTDKKNNNSSSSNSSATNTSSSNKSNNSSSSSNTSSSNKSNSNSSTTNTSSSNKSNDNKHTHQWVDHTATKQVPRTVHHDAVYETVTIPAVTKTQIRCLGCDQFFDSRDDLLDHAEENPVNDRCGASAYGDTRQVVITPARTEKKLVKKAYDETVYDTKSYVDYQYCSVCGQKK